MLKKVGGILKTINYKDIEFIDNKLNYGSFGINRKCTFNGEVYAFKEFYEDSYLKGKKMKLSLLNNIDEERFLIPKYWVKKDGRKKGYLTRFNHGKNIDEYSSNDLKLKYDLLKDAKDTILLMHEYKIIHSDISGFNLMIDNNKTSIIDFDNCFYEGFLPNINHTNDYAYDFIKKYGVIKELDIFMFNLITFSILNDISIHKIRSNIVLENYGYFNTKDAINLSNTLFLDNNFPSYDFLIDTIDETSFTI